jgi:uncharacterized membrane protein YidH (DUF202 family)
MKTKTIGVLLIAIGMLMIAYTGYIYVTGEKSVDIGQYEITKDENIIVKWPPIVGSALILGGILVLVFEKKLTAKS